MTGSAWGAKAARVSKVRPSGNTPTLTGGPATEEIHPQQEHGAGRQQISHFRLQLLHLFTGTFTSCARHGTKSLRKTP
jgi:hypothetical protein